MTVRIGIIGCGGIAKMHMKGFAACPDVKVVACSDISAERSKEFAAEFGISKSFSDYGKMLASAKLDAVSVCTPNYAHSGPTIAALEAGVHVLCEKPMAMNCAEAAEMAAAAGRTGRMLTIGHHMRFHPFARYLKRAIEAGDLGTIYFGRSHALRRRGIPGWGAFHIRAKSGGGPLIDIGVHALDLIIWLMGSPTPLRVSGSVYTKFGNRPDFYNAWGNYKREDYDVEDYACGMVRFEGGASLLLEASWAGHLPDVETFPQMILGEKGGATILPFGSPTPVKMFTSRDEALVDIIPQGFPEVQPHVEEIKHWVACLRGEAEVLVKPEESLNVQRILDGLYLSSEKGREIVVAEELPGASAPKPAPRKKGKGGR